MAKNLAAFNNLITPLPVPTEGKSLIAINGKWVAGSSPEQGASAETDESVQKGQPIYLKSNGHLGLSWGSGIGYSCIGVAIGDFLPGFACQFKTLGIITLNSWTVVTGSDFLSPSQTYYLDAINAGRLTMIPPETGYLVAVGKALSTVAMNIQIQPSILL